MLSLIKSAEYFTICREVEEIEERITGEEIDLGVRDTLFHQLDALREKAQLIKEFTDSFCALEEKIILLYGRIEQLACDREFAKVKEKTLHLNSVLATKNIRQIIEEVEQLNVHICFLRENYRPSLQHRYTLMLAHYFVANVAPQYMNGTLSVQEVREHYIFLQTAFQEIPELTPDTLELLLFLCEAIEELECRNFKEYRKKLITLPEGLQEKLEGLDLEQTLQELFSYGNTLCESLYPSTIGMPSGLFAEFLS